MSIGIYRIKSPSGRIYIGQTINLIKRINTYKGIHNNLKEQPILYNSLKNFLLY